MIIITPRSKAKPLSDTKPTLILLIPSSFCEKYISLFIKLFKSWKFDAFFVGGLYQIPKRSLTAALKHTLKKMSQRDSEFSTLSILHMNFRSKRICKESSKIWDY